MQQPPPFLLCKYLHGNMCRSPRHIGNPLPPQANATLSQGAAGFLVAALDQSDRGKSNFHEHGEKDTSIDSQIAESSPAFLVENQIAEAKGYATSEANAEALWKLSEKLVGENFDLWASMRLRILILQIWRNHFAITPCYQYHTHVQLTSIASNRKSLCYFH